MYQAFLIKYGEIGVKGKNRHIFEDTKAIVERVNEMATRTLKLEGDDFRSTARQSKSELAKKLGI